MSGTTIILAYGPRKAAADLATFGAGSRVYVEDDTKRRPERAQMFRDLRGGEVIRVRFLRDLGGSPVADKLWRARVEAQGATVEEMRPVQPARPAHRPPSVFDPTPAERERLRAVWLDEDKSLRARCDGVEAILGRRVSRQVLYWHFGKPGAPKPDTSE